MSQDEHPQPEYAELQCDLGPFAEYAKKKPKHVAIEVLPNPGPTLAIVTTAKAERQAVLARLDDGMKNVIVAGSMIIFGKIGRFDTVVLETRMGASATQDYLTKILPSLPSVVAVAFVGFGWGSDPALKSAPEEKQRIGDIMFADECIDLSHNKEAPDKLEIRGAITPPVGDILDKVNDSLIESWQDEHEWPSTWCRPPTVHVGPFVSKPTLLNNKDATLKILEAVKPRKAIGGDMEVFQIVKAVQNLKTPRKWFSVKSICDFAGLIPKVDDGQKLAAATAADFMHFLMNKKGLFDDLLAPPVAAVASQPLAEIIEKKLKINELPTSMLPMAETLIGRENIMEELAEALKKRGAQAALIGGAGMGKTSCAKEFAHKFKTVDKKNRFVFWFSSETPASLRTDYRRALTLLRESSGETTNTNDAEETVTLDKLASDVWRRLQAKSDSFEWLLVFENVPEVDGEKAGLAAFQDRYFPDADGTLGRILFTVRSDDYGGQHDKFGEITAIEVLKLDPDAATEMFKKKVGKQRLFSEDDAVRELVADFFDGLPLAIATAAGEINKRQIKASDYLARLKSQDLISIRDKVFAVLKSALEFARKNESACQVLDIAAFCNPDRIEKKLLLQNEDDTAIELLCSLCLFRHLGLDDSGDTYSIHRLHQEAARKDRSPVQAIMAIKEGFAVFDCRDSSTWNSALYVHTHAEALTSFVGASSLTTEENQIDYATILSNSGLVLWVFHNFRQALIKYEEALEIYRHVYGENAKNADLANLLHNLGLLYDNLRNYNAARTNYEKALEMKQHVYGENAKNTSLATTLHNLGNADVHLGNYNAARTNYEKALEMYRHEYGENGRNPDLATTLRSLGFLDNILGNYDAALTNYEKALEMKQHVYGENAKNADLATTLSGLGHVYENLAIFNVARTNYEKALEMYRHVYGENARNADLATTLNNLGNVYRKLGNDDAARTNYEKAREMKRHL